MRFFRFLTELFGDAWERSARPSDRIRESKPQDRKTRQRPKDRNANRSEDYSESLGGQPKADRTATATATPQTQRRETQRALTGRTTSEPGASQRTATSDRLTSPKIASTAPFVTPTVDPAVAAVWPPRPAPTRKPPVRVPALAVQGKTATEAMQQMKALVSISEASVPVAATLNIANDARRDITLHGSTGDRVTISHLRNTLANQGGKNDRTITQLEQRIIQTVRPLPEIDRVRATQFIAAQSERRVAEIDYTKYQLVNTQNQLTQTQQCVRQQQAMAVKAQVEKKALKQELKGKKRRDQEETVNPILRMVFISIVELELPVRAFTGLGLILTRALIRP